ncbi:MAG: PilZ domain-containing protein [Rhodospirillales bacterium]|nr:PilZ domain-containing protein [Alphaproteobacteria bacterium]MCB9987035.1 PilZ domain-containing protein [Rhodospirillales bacterium]USO08196.1 MAG: PilZ domain-containing protein [Rhodospirillales bacterium]
MSSIERIRKALASATNDNTEITRRRFPRRIHDVCVAEVDGTTYPVSDWSQCGVLFEADGRGFEIDAHLQVVMKFRLSETVSEIPVTARVARTGKTRVALEFVDMPKKIEKAFAKVIRDAQNARDEEAENLA